MTDSFVPTPKEFFAGFGIGDEIKKTNTFLQKRIVQFAQMVRFFYKTLKRFIFEDVIKLWPLYLSLFLLGITVSFFTPNRKRNIFFIIYIGALFITFFFFLLAIRAFEFLIKLIIMLIKGIKSVFKNFMKKKYSDAFFDWLWCSVLCFIIFIVILAILGLCIIIKNFNYFLTALFNLIESFDSFKNL